MRARARTQCFWFERTGKWVYFFLCVKLFLFPCRRIQMFSFAPRASCLVQVDTAIFLWRIRVLVRIFAESSTRRYNSWASVWASGKNFAMIGAKFVMVCSEAGTLLGCTWFSVFLEMNSLDICTYCMKTHCFWKCSAWRQWCSRARYSWEQGNGAIKWDQCQEEWWQLCA